ncbi:putative Zn finger-like uncharacterized protein [Novosphingobium kunmingense]|uniref:Putative Zn finger-like uncharacterized protein n=1 Tax=Novosphingobium kunmingense TaxID=1211806 RepID=A0A2N0H6E7_9SPHN|nr:MJ0042-type zinc finger domain-containing protein [Novosphingobium kunmingense]PKB14479.1 putative Zn finger-like uncharacterized protein [Novosphingobium kunmingense]
MIIACPACATRYAVPDSAIGVDGRTVRCAKCRHSWFQDGPALPERAAEAAPLPQPPPPPPPPVEAPAPTATEVAAPEPAPAAAPAPTVAVSVNFDRQQQPPHHGGEPAPPTPQPADEVAGPEQDPPLPPFVYDEEAPPPAWAAPTSGDTAEDDHSSFAHEPPFRPRHNPAKMWSVVAILVGSISLALIGATAWWGLPNWMPFAHPLFAEAQPGLKLDFPAKQQERHQLPDSTWYFQASGAVTNTSQESRSVPPILIVLRDARDRVVYTAEVQSPKRVLAPGESAAINEALVQVPKAAVKAEFGWKPGS